MTRRELILVLGGVAVGRPLSVRAQQPPERMRRIGVLMGAFTSTNPVGQTALAAFLDTVRGLGWTADRNARFEVRWMGDDAEDGKRYAAELVGLAPDVIFVSSSVATDLLARLTRTIPIVFTQTTDPVGSGWVKSLARPGGNVTGFALIEAEIAGKWLEILGEIAPKVSRVTVLLYSETVPYATYWHAIEAAAPSFGIRASAAGVHHAGEIEHAITAASQPNSGLIVPPSPVTNSNHAIIAELALRHRLPAVYPYRQYSLSGGLVSYGPDPINWYRQAASYVDRILRGEKPAELPVQAPTKFELVINRKAAKALDLSIPPSLLVRADEVIE